MSERITAVDVLRAVALAAFFAVQYFFSRAWRARFPMGAVEWLWRALTYFRLRPQPAAA